MCRVPKISAMPADENTETMNTSGKAALAEKPASCLARQPILNKDEKVLGYELLFRESPEEDRFNSDFEGGTRSIIDTVNVMGLDVVCDGRLAFINCTEEMLLQEFFLLLPAEKTVIEIQESIPAAENVIAACDRLKLAGYRIALDNFAPAIGAKPCFPMRTISRLTSGELRHSRVAI